MSRFNTVLHGALSALMIGAAVSVAAEGDMYKGYEVPPYRVVAQEGAIEIREYGAHLVAEVTVAGDRSGAISRGFQVLADFIFGNNADGAKVAMTSPVAQAPAGENWIVRFTMPSAFTAETLPAPANPAIRVVEAAPERQIVVSFTGRATEAELGRRIAQVRAEAEARGLDSSGEPRFYFYDGPFTLPWARRNEVALPVS